MKPFPLISLLFISFTAAPVLSAQSVPPDFPLARTSIGFGSSVAVGDDGEVFVGEPMNRIEGVVYVYRRNADGGWAEAQQLRASDHEPGDRFGRALAVRGDMLIVGATSIDEATGAAYVFERSASDVWHQVARLRPATAEPGDAFGRAVALTDDFVVVGAAGANGDRGAAWVFERSGDAWPEAATLTADVAEGAFFGLSVAASGGRIAVSAVRDNDDAGGVFVFVRDGGTWVEEAALTPTDMLENGLFGLALALDGDRMLVGAPSADQNQGAVFTYRRAMDGWLETGALAAPAEDEGPKRFGSAIALRDGHAWIGAPLAGGFAGVTYGFTLEDDAWVPRGHVTGIEAESGDEFGAALALGADVTAIGMSGDDFGEGAAVILERRGDGWSSATRIFSEVESLDAITGGEVACEEGEAALFGCQNVDIVSFLPREQIGAPRGARLNDIWGWTDPETGRDYALVGIMTHAAVVDVTDPMNPVYLGPIPRTEGSPPSTWRDIKVYRNHAFIVADGAREHGMQVFDLTRLRDVQGPPITFEPDTIYHEVHSVHNIVINEETGYAYAVGASGGGSTCGGGLHMIDIREPKQPTFAGCFSHDGTGRRGTGYSHDAQCVIYQGPDEAYQGREICFGANETALSIADVTDRENPVTIAQASYPNVAYAHQGWLNEDHTYFYSNDELDELNDLVPGTRTLVWDVQDLDDPVLVKEHIHDTQSTDHNLYVRGRYLYQTNNSAGLRILDISDPANPVEVGFFDPVPWGDDEAGFDGTWSSYPFMEDNLVLVSSRREGLFVVRFNPQTPIP